MDNIKTRILDKKEMNNILIGIVVALLLIPSIAVYGVIEDDGWVEGDDDSKGEISSQEELEEAYEGSEFEDDIGPNEFEEATGDDDDDDDDDDPKPYCDTPEGKAASSCHDRLDFYESGPNEGLYPCNDGTNRVNWKDCPDATKDKDDDEHTTETKAIVNFSPKVRGGTCQTWASYLELRLNVSSTITNTSIDPLLLQEVIAFYNQCAK
jgi:hypothetical protein